MIVVPVAPDAAETAVACGPTRNRDGLRLTLETCGLAPLPAARTGSTGAAVAEVFEVVPPPPLELLLGGSVGSAAGPR